MTDPTNKMHEAQRAADALLADPAFLAAYRDRSDPGHNAAVWRLEKLWPIAYPDGRPIPSQEG